MINNRQAGRRNRGRNNGRQNGGNRGGDNGNRIDNRARGNAPQLLEKYRNLARDAQLAGDRVNTEYYLQFADHYFRVLADNRSRQEEQQARFRRNDESLDDDGYQGDGADDLAVAAQPGNGSGGGSTGGSGGASGAGARMDDDEDGHGDDRRARAPRQARPPRQRETPREDRAEEDNVEAERDTRRRPRKAEKIIINRRDEAVARESEAGDAPAANQDGGGAPEADGEAQAPAPRRVTRGRKPRQPKDEAAGAEDAPGLDLSVLPPALARADNDDADTGGTDDGDEKPAPRRRGRRPKASAEAAE
ncbi:MAG: DUF4167 domain-containing protein [Sphingobium sp.]